MNGRLVRWALSLVHRPHPRAGASLTIIRHHRVYADGDRPLYRLGVSRAVLESQLAWLAGRGLAPLTVSEGLERLHAGKGRWVAMTFDDGYADNVERALPALERHGARATFYLTAGWMERRAAPWWDVLAHALGTAAPREVRIDLDGTPLALDLTRFAGRRRALVALLPRLRARPEVRDRRLALLRDALGLREAAPCELADWPAAARLAEHGMEIGAHTLDHPLLTTLDPGEKRSEIEGSRDRIAARLGLTPRGFAYPEGDYDAECVTIVRGAGFEHAVTTRAGDVAPGASRFELRRRGLSDGACLGPAGRFSARLVGAELDGAFDRLRGVEAAA